MEYLGGRRKFITHLSRKEMERETAYRKTRTPGTEEYKKRMASLRKSHGHLPLPKRQAMARKEIGVKGGYELGGYELGGYGLGGAHKKRHVAPKRHMVKKHMGISTSEIKKLERLIKSLRR